MEAAHFNLILLMMVVVAGGGGVEVEVLCVLLIISLVLGVFPSLRTLKIFIAQRGIVFKRNRQMFQQQTKKFIQQNLKQRRKHQGGYARPCI